MHLFVFHELEITSDYKIMIIIKKNIYGLIILENQIFALNGFRVICLHISDAGLLFVCRTLAFSSLIFSSEIKTPSLIISRTGNQENF